MSKNSQGVTSHKNIISISKLIPEDDEVESLGIMGTIHENNFSDLDKSPFRFRPNNINDLSPQKQMTEFIPN
jgi:hypothetical protein